MTFQEKSTLAMTGILVLVFGWYFALVLGQVASTAPGEIAYQGVMIPVIILLIVLAAVAHAIIAIAKPADADDDERDRAINLRGNQVAGYALAVGTVAGLGLAMVDADAFWIAQVLLAGLVIAEIAEGLTRLVLYRRGV